MKVVNKERKITGGDITNIGWDCDRIKHNWEDMGITFPIRILKKTSWGTEYKWGEMQLCKTCGVLRIKPDE